MLTSSWLTLTSSWSTGQSVNGSGRIWSTGRVGSNNWVGSTSQVRVKVKSGPGQQVKSLVRFKVGSSLIRFTGSVQNRSGPNADSGPAHIWALTISPPSGHSSQPTPRLDPRTAQQGSHSPLPGPLPCLSAV
ncbi:hypothetical protein V6N11_011948 [Hibiscus sabdariffa]|uniref:Uncharacterized protein n=1 Tax=Hibiscus sabdariffa TaxID=183260 RepID=A0ABR2S9Z7_9ROSI